MKKILYIPALLAGVAIMSSCASQKFDFSKAYYFNHYNYHKTSHAEKLAKSSTPVAATPGPLLASNEKTAMPEMPDRIAEARQNLLDKMHLKSSEVNKETIKARLKSMSRSERRAMVKDLKTEMKSFKNAESASLKTFDKQDTQKTTALQGQTRTGVIIGAVGLGLLLLGAIFGVPALTFVGVLGVLVGVVFILIGEL